MAQYNVSPVREQIRSEMLAALANGAALSATDLFTHCPSAPDSSEIARIAHDMKRSGLLQNGEKVLHPLGMRVFTYCLPTTADPRIAAAKPIQVERKIPRTGKGTKPAQDHPFKVRIVAQKVYDGAPRVTRPLPMHLTTIAPQTAAVAIDETEMSEEPMPYVTEPDDTFNQEPMEPEAPEDIDSVLVDALMGLAHLEPKDAAVDDVLAKMVPLPVAADDPAEMASADDAEMLASEYVGDQAAPRKICQCLRINSLPPLPKGYVYGGLKVWIETRHDVGHLTITTYDGGGGPFYSLKANGHLNFDTGDLVTIGQVADALIKLHQDMSHE